MSTFQVTPPRIRKRSGRLYPEFGAGTVEYVIVILVAIVIGAGLLAFGNQVSGQVTKTGGSISSWFSKANGTGGTGGGNAGGGNSETDSRIDELKEKDPADWTLDDQKAVAEDIGKKGNSSELYSKAKDAMDAGTTWSITLTDGKTMTYRIIGINHDDLADGSGKAGLTFEATSKTFGKQRINANDTNVGGWKVSELRGRLNSGDLWSLLPTNFTGKIRPVTKMTDNQGGGTHGQPTATIDKVFIISTTEFFGDLHSDGGQYEYYKDKGVALMNYSMNEAIDYHWTRSVNETYTVPGYEPFSNRFCYTMTHGPGRGVGDPSKTENVFPAWCF